jgi:hypothetical protein
MSLLRIAIRALVAYVFLLALLRVSGKRKPLREAPEHPLPRADTGTMKDR